MQLKLRNNIYDECYLGLSKQEYIEKIIVECICIEKKEKL